LAALFGGGWFVTSGPGVGVLQQLWTQAASAPAQGQPGLFGPSINTQPPAASGQFGYSQATPAPQPSVPAINANYRPQPVTPPPTPFEGGPAIHIASFNIQVFGDTKASKPYVMATLASIIHNFHIVAIQEIRTQDDYFIDNFLRTYVNRDGRRYDRVVGPRLGRSHSKEQYAFIYDTNVIELGRNSVYTMHDPDDLLHREPLVAMFRTRAPPESAFTFVLVNIHTDPDETDRELDALGQVYQVVRRAAGGEDDIILLGDLNVDDQHLGELGRLQGVRAIVRGTPTNSAKSAQYDNIIVHQSSTAEFTGRWGVYDIGRMHNLSPEQVQQVSDHLPVWAEFSAYEASAPGRIAERGGELWTQ
jgi:endonuclease/exonuclease/phosphatase family metal-dependent hydrolase